MFCSRCGTVLPEGATYCPRCGAPVEPSSISTVSVPYTPGAAAAPAGPRYGGFWRRGWALLIDEFIIGLVSLPLAFAMGFPMAFMRWSHGDIAPEELGAIIATGLLVGFCSLILKWLYYALLESSSRQASLGKMALGVRVTDLAGQRVSFGRASGRFFATYLSRLTLGIGFLMIAFTEKKQGLHDMIARTLVLRA